MTDQIPTPNRNSPEVEAREEALPAPAHRVGDRAVRMKTRLLPVLALMILAPISAEYLSAASGAFGGPSGLLIEMAIALPIYGTVAVLIREFVRRAGRGWPTMLMVAAGCGLIQAGIIDQGLFNPNYVDDPSWQESRNPTLIEAADFSVRQFFSFIGGHMVWSFVAPIAIIEACFPSVRSERWLGRGGIAAIATLYLLGAVFVFTTHVQYQEFLATPAQLAGATVIALGLIIAGFKLPQLVKRDHGQPPAWAVGALSAACAAVSVLAPDTWIGVAMCVVAMTVTAIVLLHCSRLPHWTTQHVLAVAFAPLLVNAVLAFTLTASEGPSVVRYMANAIAMTVLLAIAATAWWRTTQLSRQPHVATR